MPLETPAGYRPLDAASLPPFLATLPAVRGPARRQARRLEGQRSRRRKSESGFHCQRSGRWRLRQAGPALCAAGGRRLADAAEARLLRASMPDRAWPPCGPAAAGDLSLRSAALCHRHGTAAAAHHHAPRHDPGNPLSPICRRHCRLHGEVAVLHVRPGAAGRRQETEDGGVLRQHRALQDHRGSDLHRSLHGP